jgi:hypothetical protein
MSTHKVPLWLRKQHLIPGEYAPGTTIPTAHDIEVFLAALTGLEPGPLRSRFGVPSAELIVSIKTVRDAIKRGEVPDIIDREYAWVIPIITKKVYSQALAQRTLDVSNHEQAIARITDVPYEPMDSTSPTALPKFLHEAKTRFAVAAGPLTLKRLAEDVLKGSPTAVQHAREFLYGKQDAPTVAIQQNFSGPGGPDNVRSTPAFQYEKVILEYEAQHPENAGEVTQFNESLLEGQESETES